MPTDIRVIHARDFLKATPEGQLDLEHSNRLLIEIASASAHLVDHGMILDTRQTHSELSVTDLWYLAAELGKFRKALSRKTAVLCPRERFDYAGFFALCAQNEGFQVKAFLSYEDAIEWLGE
jgi:hypothetical protein